MTIAELIEELSQFPDHWTVFTGKANTSENDLDIHEIIQEVEDDDGNPEICIVGK